MSKNKSHPELSDVDWLQSDNIRPYIFMRSENRFSKPGTKHKSNWFTTDVLFKDPLKMSEVDFADQILALESKAFQKSGMPMPRWVFFDCAIMPGVVCGFAQKTETLSKSVCEALNVNKKLPWTPISLFIIIPTIRDGEWVAHNLCTANSLVEEKDQLYALGFLSKAFGLWYANVDVLCGMTQWQSPAIRLHSHFGTFEVLTAYTPVHSHARTLTYRCKIRPDYWPSFFKDNGKIKTANYVQAGFSVDPKDDTSLKGFQSKIESNEGPFYLNPSEIRARPLDASLDVYKLGR